MADEPLKPSRTLLSDLPPTDPAEIKAMQEGRIEMLHYAAIGRVAAGWSHLEALIDSSSITLAGIKSENGACFTAHIFGTGRKLDAFIALARLRGISAKLTEDLHDFAKDVRGLAVQRDRVIHDFWYFPHPNPPTRVETTAVKVLRILQFPVETKELLKLNDNIEVLRDRFAGLFFRIHAELHPFPGTVPSGTAS